MSNRYQKVELVITGYGSTTDTGFNQVALVNSANVNCSSKKTNQMNSSNENHIKNNFVQLLFLYNCYP